MKKPYLVKTTLIFIILFSSCDLFNSEDEPTTGSLIGQWIESNAVISLVLTTNSAQTATNFLNSTGKLSITGGYQTKLPFLIETPEDEDGFTLLVAANPTGFLGFTDTTYMLGLDPNDVDAEGALIVQANDESEFEDNLHGNVSFSYDGLNLNIANSTLTSDDTQISVNVSGSITYQQVSISANQATALNFNASQFYNFGNTVTTFFADSTFLSSEDQGLGDSTGTWLVVGDTLKLTTETEIEDITTGEPVMVDTTVSLGYTNNGSKLTVTQNIDICKTAMENDDEMTCEEVYSLIEEFFGLDESSIKKADFIFQLIFDRIPDGQVAKMSTKKPAQNWPANISEQLKIFLPNI